MTENSATSPAAPNAAQAVARAIADGIDAGRLELPVMPQTAAKVFRLAQDPEADTESLSGLIHSDQSIASHVLRIANSAAYGAGEPIVSLQQAVTRLGMRLLGEIAIAVSLQSEIFRAPGFEGQIKALLKHALASAAFGREIARMRRRNVEGQFLCGLLHSVGRPICLQLIARSEQSLNPAEVAKVVDSLHLKIAARAAADWKLPAQLQVATIHFSRYEQAPSFRDECAATYLSQLLATWLLQSDSGSASEIAADPALAFLNFYPDDLDALLAKADEVRAVVAALEI